MNGVRVFSARWPSDDPRRTGSAPYATRRLPADLLVTSPRTCARLAWTGRVAASKAAASAPLVPPSEGGDSFAPLVFFPCLAIALHGKTKGAMARPLLRWPESLPRTLVERLVPLLAHPGAALRRALQAHMHAGQRV